MPASRSHTLRPILLIGMLAAFAVRLHRLGAESLWYDETVSVYLASHSVVDLIAHTARDIHPPGYYLLLHGWRLLAQPTPAHGLEFLYAWPSLWFGMVTVALMVALAQRLGGRFAALFAVTLAAVNPFQVMYAQEVRMYTLGACALLVSLWGAAQFIDLPSRPRVKAQPLLSLFTYGTAVVVGLYTLYYFIFWLAVLIPWATFILLRQRRIAGRGRLRAWLAAHLVIVLAWLPWLPVFIRQALNPPVPPWRTPWASGRDAAAALAEALAAPLAGQSVPALPVSAWAALVAMVLAAYIVYTQENQSHPLAGRWTLPLLLAGPAALILALTLTVTPIYHVRYLATYAALFPVIAALVVARQRPRPWLAGGVFVTLLAASSAALFTLWRAPDLRADDHRAAVAALARAWRPGDVILANAGWIYPALDTYWPTQPAGPLDAVPPALSTDARLTAFVADESASPLPQDRPSAAVVRTGSVDAPGTLGWGHPESDFFAISSADTEAALRNLAHSYRRMWHYRLYDTVNDPEGRIRAWLADYPLFFSATYPGPGFLRVEGYSVADPLLAQTAAQAPAAAFEDSLRLLDFHAPPSLPAGEILYLSTQWQPLTASAEPLAASLRLYDQAGMLVAQSDEALPHLPAPFDHTLALPIPAATAPGTYALTLIIYRQDSLAPLSVTGASPTADNLKLASLAVTLPSELPHSGRAIARFDYLELTRAAIPAAASPGAPFHLDLIWRPRPSPYRDHYSVSLRLETSSGQYSDLGTFALQANTYPSTEWATRYPVRQQIAAHVPNHVLTGDYRLVLRLTRTADGLPIPVQRPFRPWREDALDLGPISIQPEVARVIAP